MQYKMKYETLEIFAIVNEFVKFYYTDEQYIKV